MPFDPIYLVYGVIFIFVLLLIEGLYYLLLDARGGEAQAINRRLRLLASGAQSEDVLAKLRRTPKRKKVGLVRTGLKSPIARLDSLMTQAGLTMSTARMLTLMGVLAGLLTLVLTAMMAMAMGKALLLGLAAGVLLPVLYLMYRRHRRLKLFGEQFPDTLDLIVRSLRAGHPVSVSMGLVAKEMPDPIGTEFGIAVDEMTYGLDLHDALQNMAARVPLQDLQYLVVAISVQHGVGGNLANVLAGLSSVIRDRFNMFKKIKALSAEGRLSAIVLSALPFVVGGAVWMLNPNYFTAVSDDPLFPVLMGVGGGMLLLGLVIIWKLVRFRV